MMIGLATGHRVYNYGTRLQAYAMQNIMRSRGHECEIIRYVNTGNSGLKAGAVAVLARSTLYGYYAREKELRKYLENSRNCPAAGELRKNIRKRFRAFDGFNREKLNIREICCSYSKLTPETEAYGAVFCGSDQAWLPSNIRYRVYTLEFCGENVRRISYAPSFGVHDIPGDMEEVYSSFLKRMDYISVRETRGRELVKQFIGKEVPVVLDPTLLLEASFWEQEADDSKVPSGTEYIFCYFLGDNPRHREAVKKLKEETGLSVVSIAHMKGFVEADTQMTDLELYDVSPLEFLGLVRNAKYVCTDSFHGTAFSIQFHRDFYVFPRHTDADRMSTNSRINSVLELLDAQDRLVDAGMELLRSPVNYQKIDEKLKILRMESNRYLDQALDGLR